MTTETTKVSPKDDGKKAQAPTTPLGENKKTNDKTPPEKELFGRPFWIGLFILLAFVMLGVVGLYFLPDHYKERLPERLRIGKTMPPQKKQDAPVKQKKVSSPAPTPEKTFEEKPVAPTLPAIDAFKESEFEPVAPMADLDEGLRRYASELEGLLAEKDDKLYAWRSESREAQAKARRLRAERDEAVALAGRIHTAYAFLDVPTSAKKRGYAEKLAAYSPDVKEAMEKDGALATRSALLSEFDALYTGEDTRNVHVVSWSFLPEFLQKYARRWLYIEKKDGNRWKDVRIELEKGDAAEPAAAIRAARAENDEEFNAWADKYAAFVAMRRAVDAALSRWQGMLAELAEKSETER